MMTNEQCKGYMIVAMYEAGIPMKDIHRVVDSMNYWFDMISEEEAEIRGNKILAAHPKYGD